MDLRKNNYDILIFRDITKKRKLLNIYFLKSEHNRKEQNSVRLYLSLFCFCNKVECSGHI